MVLRTSLTPLGCASPSPFKLNDIIFEGRPQPEKMGRTIFRLLLNYIK